MATGKIKATDWKLLWTNPDSIGSNFSAQTVSLNLSNYSELKIYAAHYDGVDTSHTGWGEYIQIVPIGVQSAITLSVVSSNKVVYTNYRYVYASSTGVTFGVGIECNTSNGMSQVANSMQPLRIYAR